MFAESIVSSFGHSPGQSPMRILYEKANGEYLPVSIVAVSPKAIICSNGVNRLCEGSSLMTYHSNKDEPVIPAKLYPANSPRNYA